MRRIVPIVAAAIAWPSLAQAQPAAPAVPDVSTFATSADVQALIGKARAALKPGQAMLSQPVVRLAPYAASLEYRVLPPRRWCMWRAPNSSMSSAAAAR